MCSVETTVKLLGIPWNYPHRVTVTFIHFDSFLVGNPYKPSFMTVTGWGVDLRYTQIVAAPNVSENQVLLRGDFTLGGVFYC